MNSPIAKRANTGQIRQGNISIPAMMSQNNLPTLKPNTRLSEEALGNVRLVRTHKSSSDRSVSSQKNSTKAATHTSIKSSDHNKLNDSLKSANPSPSSSPPLIIRTTASGTQAQTQYYPKINACYSQATYDKVLSDLHGKKIIALLGMNY